MAAGEALHYIDGTSLLANTGCHYPHNSANLCHLEVFLLPGSRPSKKFQNFVQANQHHCRDKSPTEWKVLTTLCRLLALLNSSDLNVKVPGHTDSSRNGLTEAHNTCCHQDMTVDFQDTQHHYQTIHPHSSQPPHSMTQNVIPGYKSLLTGHIWYHWDNSAACLNSRQPAITATIIMTKHSAYYCVRYERWTKQLIV